MCSTLLRFARFSTATTAVLYDLVHGCIAGGAVTYAAPRLSVRLYSCRGKSRLGLRWGYVVTRDARAARIRLRRVSPRLPCRWRAIRTYLSVRRFRRCITYKTKRKSDKHKRTRPKHRSARLRRPDFVVPYPQVYDPCVHCPVEYTAKRARRWFANTCARRSSAQQLPTHSPPPMKGASDATLLADALPP